MQEKVPNLIFSSLLMLVDHVAIGTTTNESKSTINHVQELIIIPFQSTNLMLTCFVILLQV